MATEEILLDSKRVSLALNGDHDAFRTLIKQHEKLVYSVVFRMVRNEADARDIAQETFIRAFRNLKTFRAESKFSTWIVRIAVTQSLNYLRKKGIDPLHEASEEIAEISSGKNENSIQLERRKTILKAIDSLPSHYKAAVLLHDMEGYSYKEIAQILECPIGTVMSRLSQAKKILKDKLQILMKEYP